MGKGRLHHKQKKIKRFRPAYFVVLFLISAVICLFALRNNSLQMAKLRDQVYKADKQGQGVEPALQKLQYYVTHHMNTNLTSPNGVHPPIQLQHTYRRHQEKQIKGLGQDSLYTKAQTHCQQKYPVESSSYVWNKYVDCVQGYLDQNDIHIEINNNKTPASLYKFDFASPTWSPDLAGLSLLASILFLSLAIIFALIDWWIRRRLAA